MIFIDIVYKEQAFERLVGLRGLDAGLGQDHRFHFFVCLSALGGDVAVATGLSRSMSLLTLVSRETVLS